MISRVCLDRLGCFQVREFLSSIPGKRSSSVTNNSLEKLYEAGHFPSVQRSQWQRGSSLMPCHIFPSSGTFSISVCRNVCPPCLHRKVMVASSISNCLYLSKLFQVINITVHKSPWLMNNTTVSKGCPYWAHVLSYFYVLFCLFKILIWPWGSISEPCTCIEVTLTVHIKYATNPWMCILNTLVNKKENWFKVKLLCNNLECNLMCQ